MEYALDIATKQNIANARLSAIESKLDRIVALLSTLIDNNDNKKVDGCADEEHYEDVVEAY